MNQNNFFQYERRFDSIEIVQSLPQRLYLVHNREPKGIYFKMSWGLVS